MKKLLTAIGPWIFYLLLLIPCITWADSTLSWNVSDEVVTGYRIYYGTNQGGEYPEYLDAGNVTQYSLHTLPLTERQTYYFVVRAYNDVGESDNSNEVSWTAPDTTPPAPPSGVSCENGGSRVAWQANSESDIGEYRICYGTSPRSYGPFQSLGNVTEYTIDGLTEGNTYYFAVSAVDTSGNESGLSAEVSSTITDSQNPSVIITSPTSESIYTSANSSITLVGSASDNVNVNRVEWGNSLGGNGLASGAENWTTDINLVSGVNVITINAYDDAGNLGSTTLSITYTPPDTTNPVVSITAPTSNETYETDVLTIDLSGSASDNVGVHEVTWANSAGETGTAMGTTDWSIRGLQLTAGINMITVIAKDLAGNEGAGVLSVTYMPPDTINPILSIASPVDVGNYETGRSTINLAGSASDNKGVSQVRWANSRGGSDVAVGTENWSISDVSLAEGVNEITVTALDEAGNSGTKTLSVTYTLPDECASVVLSNNRTHTRAGRAYEKGKKEYYAVGSDQFLGDAKAVTALSEETTGYWVRVTNCEN
jgi:hypothetical protein